MVRIEPSGPLAVAGAETTGDRTELVTVIAVVVVTPGAPANRKLTVYGPPASSKVGVQVNVPTVCVSLTSNAALLPGGRPVRSEVTPVSASPSGSEADTVKDA